MEVTDHVVGAAFGDQLKRGLATKRGEWLLQSLDRFVMVARQSFGSQHDALHILHVSLLVEGPATDASQHYTAISLAIQNVHKLPTCQTRDVFDRVDLKFRVCNFQATSDLILCSVWI